MNPVFLTGLLACGPKPAALAPPGHIETVQQFAIEFRGHTMAGVAIAVFDGHHLRFQALTPAGTALFHVESDGEVQTVKAPDERWATALEPLPLYRDMALVHTWSCPSGKCSVDGGRLTQEPLDDGGIIRTWNGPGGKAEARIWDGRAEVRDTLRGYVVRLAGEDIHAR
jgi:hypothetical protein